MTSRSCRRISASGCEGISRHRAAARVTLERLPMSPTREKSQLMSASEIDRTLVRLAHEILERTEDPERSGVHRHPPPGRAPGAAPGQQDRSDRGAQSAGRNPGYPALPRRSFDGRQPAGGERHRYSVSGRGQRCDPDGRRAVHRAHDARGAGRPVRSRPAGARAAAGADRPRLARASDRGALHRPHGADRRRTKLSK